MKKIKHVCVLTTAHPTDDVRVYEKFVKSFQSKYKVSWIGPDHSFFANKLVENEVSWEVFPYRPGMFGRLIHLIRAVKALRKLKKVDYIYCPDPDAALLAILFKAHSSKVIFDIHEVYHKDLLNRRLKGISYKVGSSILLKGIRWLCKKSAIVVGVSKTVLGYYLEQESKGLVIRSCASISVLTTLSQVSGVKNRFFTIMHGKNHLSRGTATVLKAARILGEEGSDFRVLVVDQYSEISQGNPFFDLVDELDVRQFIDVRKGMPLNVMHKEIAKCHVGLIAYGKELGTDSLPNRLFEYMAAGLPVIAPNYAVEIVQIVQRERCGLVVDMEDANELAKAIKYMQTYPDIARGMGENGRLGFRRRHNWEKEVGDLLTLVDA